MEKTCCRHECQATLPYHPYENFQEKPFHFHLNWSSWRNKKKKNHKVFMGHSTLNDSSFQEVSFPFNTGIHYSRFLSLLFYSPEYILIANLQVWLHNGFVFYFYSEILDDEYQSYILLTEKGLQRMFFQFNLQYMQLKSQKA